MNNACMEAEMEVTLEEALAGVEDPRYRPVQAIHHTLRRQNSHIYAEIGTDKMFSIRMIGVEVSSRGQGVATKPKSVKSTILAGTVKYVGENYQKSMNYHRKFRFRQKSSRQFPHSAKELEYRTSILHGTV